MTLQSRRNTSSHPHARAPALVRHLPCKRCAATRRSSATSPRPLASHPAHALPPAQEMRHCSPAAGDKPPSPVCHQSTSHPPGHHGREHTHQSATDAASSRDAGKRMIQHSTLKLASVGLHEYTSFHSCCTLLPHLLLASARGSPSVGIGSTGPQP